VDLRLTGKRSIVTGGSRGIGRAVASALAREGCEVAISARNLSSLDETAQAIAVEVRRDVHVVPADTGDDVSVREMVAKVAELLGGIDILVNSAAKPIPMSAAPKLQDVTKDLFWDDMNVKVLGYLRCAQAVAPFMVAQGWGRIINVSGLGARSTTSLLGSMRNVSVAAMTKNLADELGPMGVNVTVVHPGRTRTEATPALISRYAEDRGISQSEAEQQLAGNSIRRLVDATEVADVVAFLASPRSAAINGDAVACGGGSPGSIYY
jgi:NAD(P)-dependent dehydrogenase (short-subunit alcohol dehydrogenase family)